MPWPASLAGSLSTVAMASFVSPARTRTLTSKGVVVKALSPPSRSAAMWAASAF